MTEWEVVGVLVVLVGLVAAIVGPIIKLNTTITKLAAVVESVQRDIGDITDRNSKSHARIFEKLDEEDLKLQNHETRITVLEKK